MREMVPGNLFFGNFRLCLRGRVFVGRRRRNKSLQDGRRVIWRGRIQQNRLPLGRNASDVRRALLRKVNIAAGRGSTERTFGGDLSYCLKRDQQGEYARR